jgi:hypothetical protein
MGLSEFEIIEGMVCKPSNLHLLGFTLDKVLD